VSVVGGLQSRFFPGNAGFQPASEFVGILPAQGGDSIPQPSRRLEACVPRDFAILLVSVVCVLTFSQSQAMMNALDFFLLYRSLLNADVVFSVRNASDDMVLPVGVDDSRDFFQV